MSGTRRTVSEDLYKRLRPMIEIPEGALRKQVPPDFDRLTDFTILTYNILAQDHIKRTSYPYCSKMSLRWGQRRELLSRELAGYDADIVCFQEMDRFHSYFQPLLYRLGYHMTYYMRNGTNGDVNCVGWKKEKFHFVESRRVSFEQTTAALGSVPNVAQLVAVQSIKEPSVKLIVATTHLYWREDCDHIRLAQMHALLSAVVEFRDSLGMDYIPIIAGDFNSDPDSMALQAALRSKFYLGGPAFEEMLEKSLMSRAVLRQILSDFAVSWPRLYDAYEAYAYVIPGSNSYGLPYTSFCLYKGILDFILYQQYEEKSRILAPIALRVIPERSILEKEGALPNSIYASDHLALECRLAVFQNAAKSK